MKTNAMKLHVQQPMPWASLLAAIRPRAWIADMNWYQVAMVAIATFALSMDLMFPPVRVAVGDGLAVYVGHAFMPLATGGVVEVDFMWLAIELLLIIAAAVVGWIIGKPAGERRKSASGSA